MATQKLSTLERLQRLEKVERDRLERRERLKQTRTDTLSSASDAAHIPESAVERFEHRADFPMVVLGFAWFVVLVLVLTDAVTGSPEELLVGILFALSAIAVVEYVVRLVMAPDMSQYVAARKIEPAVVVVPAFQFLRLFGLDKVSLVFTEFILRVKAILLHRGLIRVLLVVTVLVFLAAWLVLLAEDNAPGSNIHNYGDAAWWAIVTVTTIGYGDRFPVTDLGRIVAVVLMLIGIGLIGVLTATVASFFVREHADENKAQLEKAHEDLGGRLSDLDDRLARLEDLLASALGAQEPGDPS